MLGLLPKAAGAASIGILRGEVTDRRDGWHLFVGEGPHFEFREGSEADYEETIPSTGRFQATVMGLPLVLPQASTIAPAGRMVPGASEKVGPATPLIVAVCETFSR